MESEVIVGQMLRHDHANMDIDIQHLFGHKPEQGLLAGMFSEKVHTDNPWLSDTPSANDDTYSLDEIDEELLRQFHRAEYSLGHALDEPKKFEQENLQRSCNVIDISDHHNFKYSVRETALEQDSAHLSGNNVDANLVTNIGRLKNGIQDPDAQGKKERAKAADDSRFIQQMMRDQDILAEIEAQIEELRLEIEELNIEIEDLQDAQAAAEGDLDGNDSASSARRRKVDIALSKQGLSLDDFRGADGKVDSDKLRDTLREREDEAISAREEIQQKLNELEQQREEIRQERDNRHEPTALAELQKDSNDILTIQKNRVENLEETTLLVASNELWGILPEATTSTPTNDPQQNIHGSFSATEGERNVITPAFAAAIALDRSANISAATPEMENIQTAEQIQYAAQENRNAFRYGYG